VSDPMYPGVSAPRSRPSVVTISSYLLYLSAAASAIGAVLALSMVGTTRDVYTEMYEGTTTSGLEGVVVGTTVVVAVINILFAAGLVVLAIFNNRGKRAARITTWVVGGIFVCCNGFSLIGSALGNLAGMETGGNAGPSPKEVEERLSEELPGWFGPASMLLTAVVVLALLGAVILLALPPANEYFRKVAVGWDPLNQPGYPAHQPQYPAQPPYPGQPSYPSYPGGDPSYPGSTPPPGSDATPPSGSVPPAGGASSGAAPDPNAPGAAPADPWSAPPPPPGEDRPGRSPTDPA